jgi:predicted amidohydrolase
VVLPELAGSGYAFPSRETLSEHAEVADGTGAFLGWLWAQCRKYDFDIVAGFAEREGDRFYNSAALIGPEGVIGVYRKIHLFDSEKEVFTPGDKGVPVFERRGVKVAMLICYDWAFPEVWRMAACSGADLVAHPSNLVLPFCQTATPGHALCNRIWVVTANRIGSEQLPNGSEIAFTGGSLALNPFAHAEASGPQDEEWEGVFDFDVELARNKSVTTRNDLLQDRREYSGWNN